MSLNLSWTILEENWNGKFGVDIPKIKLAKAWKELIEELKKIFMSGGMSCNSN